MTAHYFGQDIIGISDLFRRAALQHEYLKGVNQKPEYTAVVLHTEGQAVWSGKLRYIQADFTFGVVAPGSAKEGLPTEDIRNADKRAFDWDSFITAYVLGEIFHEAGGLRGCAARTEMRATAVVNAYVTCVHLGVSQEFIVRAERFIGRWQPARCSRNVFPLMFLNAQCISSFLEPYRPAFLGNGDWKEGKDVRRAVPVLLPRGRCQRAGRAAGGRWRRRRVAPWKVPVRVGNNGLRNGTTSGPF